MRVVFMVLRASVDLHCRLFPRSKQTGSVASVSNLPRAIQSENRPSPKNEKKVSETAKLRLTPAKKCTQ